MFNKSATNKNPLMQSVLMGKRAPSQSLILMRAFQRALEDKTNHIRILVNNGFSFRKVIYTSTPNWDINLLVQKNAM